MEKVPAQTGKSSVRCLFFFFSKHVTAAAMAFLLQQIMLCVICFLVSKRARAILLCNVGVLLPAAFFVEVSFLISARWRGTKGHLSSITAFTVPAMRWRPSYCGLTRFVHGCDHKSTKSKRPPVCLWREAEKQMGRVNCQWSPKKPVFFSTHLCLTAVETEVAFSFSHCAVILLLTLLLFCSSAQILDWPFLSQGVLCVFKPFCSHCVTLTRMLVQSG